MGLVSAHICHVAHIFKTDLMKATHSGDIKGYLRRGVVGWGWFGGGAAAGSSQWQPGHPTSSRFNPPVSEEISNLSKKKSIFCILSC